MKRSLESTRTVVSLAIGLWLLGMPVRVGSQETAGSPRGEAEVRWLAIGGGSTPDMTEVSIEQDVALAARVFGPSGLILFAGGAGARVVQVLDRAPRGDPLVAELAALFAPRRGRDSHYRRSRLPIAAPATLPNARAAVQRLVARAGDPLLLYIAGHGERAQHPADNWVGLWGSSPLSVVELARWLDGGKRPVRVIVTACYGGGFAELVFAGADARRGAAPTTRCGLFATVHDLPSSGCDPNPDRAAQQGYALHFLNALRGRDRHGKPLELETVDLDGDGRVSLLEAHARVRIVSRAADVPSATSERWLRHAVSRKHKRRRQVELPEERAVVAALSKQTGLKARLGVVRRRLKGLERKNTAARERHEEAARVEADAARAVFADMLARWPVLDDPWHPDFASLLARERKKIASYLANAPRYAAYRLALRAVNDSDAAHWDLRRETAAVERLARALTNIDLAGRLRARGGRKWKVFTKLLACERGVP